MLYNKKSLVRLRLQYKDNTNNNNNNHLYRYYKVNIFKLVRQTRTKYYSWW